MFRELLGFDGNELYIRAVPELTGHTYDEVLTAFERVVRSSGCAAPAS